MERNSKNRNEKMELKMGAKEKKKKGEWKGRMQEK